MKHYKASVNNKKKKKKKRSKNILLIIIILILICTIIFSFTNIIIWAIDSKKSGEIKNEIDEIATVDEVSDNENTKLVGQPEESEELNDYWYYVKFPLINVDFDELKTKNSDTIGWINVNNTNINYPIVQTDNNDYYLNHSFDKTWNDAGWVFLDYRNNSNFSDKNTIIYAHSRLDKTMFGSLSKALNPNWHKNKDNHIIRISNEEENSLWQIFSVYVIETESYYITTSFNDNTSYLDFLNTMKDRSKYNFNTTLTAEDRIITLSTCYDDDRKTVVHAKLLKKETR